MKKSKFIILLLLIILLVGCGKKESEVTLTPEEIKNQINELQDFVSGDKVHQEFISTEELKKNEPVIEWVEEITNVNIRGNVVNGYEAVAVGNSDSFILSLDGTLYRNRNNNFSLIKIDNLIKKIGVYYINYGGSNACNNPSLFVIETDKGLKYFDIKEDTGALAIKDFKIDKYFVMPSCYGVTDSKLNDKVKLLDNGNLFVNDILARDYKTKKQLNVKYLIYAEKDEKEKYLLITNEDILYVLDDVSEFYKAISKVIVDVKPSVEGEDADVNVTISYGDVIINMTYLKNQAKKSD